jgi:hypothetical protein
MALTWGEEYDLKKLLEKNKAKEEKSPGLGGCFTVLLALALTYLSYYLIINWVEKVNNHMKSANSRLERLEKHEGP